MEINFLRLIHLEIFLEVHLTTCKEIEKAALGDPKVKTSLTSEDGQNLGTIPMPMLATRPLTMSYIRPVDILQNHMVGQQRQQLSELQFHRFPTPPSFLVWNTRLKTQVSSGSDFPSGAMLWIKEVEMVGSLDELKSSRSVYGKDFPNFEMLDAKIASALNKMDHPEFPVQKEGQPRGAESPKKKTGFCEGDKSPSSTTTFE